MNPLVEEYQQKVGAKGTELNWMPIAVQKSEEFVRNFVKILFTLAILELSWEFTRRVLS